MNRLLPIAFALFATGICLAGNQSLAPEQWAVVEKAIRLPERGSWRLDFRSSDGRAENPNIPDAVSVESTRVALIQRDVIHWKTGQTTEAWTINGVYLAEDLKSGQIFFDVSPTASNRIGAASWVAPENFLGIKEAGKKKAALFGGRFPLLHLWPGHLMKDPGGGEPDVSAAINLDDGLLIGVRIDRTEASFSWLPAPGGDLVPPSRFIEKYRQIRRGIQAARPPEKP